MNEQGAIPTQEILRLLSERIVAIEHECDLWKRRACNRIEAANECDPLPPVPAFPNCSCEKCLLLADTAAAVRAMPIEGESDG